MTEALRRYWRRLPISARHRTQLRIARDMWFRTIRRPIGTLYHVYENREVRRVAEQLGEPPSAMVVTVIATYRRPDGLRAAVESALAQTVTDHLVLVVDDGGGLPELPADDRVMAIALRRNYGCLGMVRNVGIRVTRSDYLAFLDDDNTWTPRHLEVSLSAHREGANVTYTALQRVRPDGSTFDIFSVPFDGSTLWHRNPVDSNALVLRRSSDVTFSRIPQLKEDWELVQRLSRKGRRIVHVPDPTVRYLVNPHSYYTPWTDRHVLGDAAEAS